MMHYLNKSDSKKESINTGLIMSLTYGDRIDYLGYKNGSSRQFSEERLEHMEILSTLEKLNFPMDEVGTYFFKDVIIKAIRYLDGVDDYGDTINQHELLQQLKNPYSQFYFDLARNDMDLGLKSFHSCIEHALESVDYGTADTTLLSDIYSNFSKETDYGEHALIISNYMKSKKSKNAGYQYSLVSPVKVQVGF